MGAPLEYLMDPIVNEINEISELTPMVVAALTEVQAYIPDQELITQVDGIGISRVLDIINIQVYLRSVGLVLVVGTVQDNQIPSGNFIEVISPCLEVFPDITTFSMDEADQDQTVEIVDVIAEKYILGDLSIVPESQLRNSLKAIKDMASKGMTIFPVYKDSLVNALLSYEFQIYYVMMR